MSRSKFAPLVKSLLPRLPGFGAKGKLLFMMPVGHILQGIYLDPSSFDSVTFYVCHFVMPLCVPSNHIYFNFGDRIQPTRKGAGWKLDTPDIESDLAHVIKHDALPFLSQRSSLLDFAEMASGCDSIRSLQATAYCLALAGQTSGSIGALDRLLAKEASDVAWQIGLVDQARAFRAELIENPEAARQQLMVWEAETTHHIGLTKFRA